MARWVHRIRRMAEKLAGGSLDLLLPPSCACCSADLPTREDDLLLCPECCKLLGTQVWLGCPRCGAVGAMADRDASDCALCRRTPLKFDTVVALGGYRDQLRETVLRMKRPAGDALSSAVGQFLCLRRSAEIERLEADLVVPVPMYWTRRLSRGTNSPEIIAARLARRLKIPVARRVMRRCRHTLPQNEVRPNERVLKEAGAVAVAACVIARAQGPNAT